MKQPPEISIIETNVIYDKWANLSEYRLKYKSEKFDTELSRVVFDSGDGAAIFLYSPEEKKVILVRQFRYGVFLNNPKESMMLEVCAGIIEHNNPRETAIREALEETGYQLSEIDHVATVYATPGAHTEKLYLYIGIYNDTLKISKGGGVDTENEDIEVLEYSYKELLSLYNNHEILDSKTLILVQHWLINVYHKNN